MFNVQNFYVLSTECIFVVCMDLRKMDNFYPKSVFRLIFITDDLSVYCAVQAIVLNIFSG